MVKGKALSKSYYGKYPITADEYRAAISKFPEYTYDEIDPYTTEYYTKTECGTIFYIYITNSTYQKQLTLYKLDLNQMTIRFCKDKSKLYKYFPEFVMESLL